YYIKMRIGSIGRGMVGEAIYQGLINCGHEMSSYDPKFENSKMEDILNDEIVFVSVPTIPNEKNECDLSIIHAVLKKLSELNYPGIICIKSTVTPGTTQKLIEEYNN